MAVVGGGITGLTTAVLLAERGMRVAVLERGRMGSGATGRSTGHLSTLPDAGYEAIELRFGLEAARSVARGTERAIDDIERFAHEIGAASAFHRATGYCFTESFHHRDELADRLAAARRVGLRVREVDPVPLPFRTCTGFAVEGQAALEPEPYMAALARRALSDGCLLFEQSPVLAVEDGAPCRVVTKGGVVTASAVVLATHTPLGPSVLHAALTPRRSYALALHGPGRPPPGLFWDMAPPYDYLRARVGDEAGWVVGGCDHRVGRGDPVAASSALELYVRERFGPVEILRRWSSQHYASADGLPLIGHAPMSTGVLLATGFGGDGLVYGMVAARLLADLLHPGRSRDEALYQPSRVRVGTVTSLLRQNLDVARHFVRDRIAPAELHALGAVAREEGRLVKLGRQMVAAYRDQAGHLHAHDARCTHMRCIVQWNRLERTWDCPCHGSRYDIEGRVLEGPATTQLAPFQPGPEGEPPGGRLGH